MNHSTDGAMLQVVRNAVAADNSRQALRELEDDYRAINTFLSTLQNFMQGDASALGAQRVHTSFCTHLLLQSHLGASHTFCQSETQPPKNQHDALMFLHNLTQKLNNYALDTEAQRSRLEALQVGSTATRVAPDESVGRTSIALAERREEAAKLLVLHPECERLTGAELRDAVDRCREEVNRWVSEKEDLLLQIARTETEVEALRGDGEVATGPIEMNDGARSMQFRNARMERMRIDAQIDTLRRILCLPLR